MAQATPHRRVLFMLVIAWCLLHGSSSSHRLCSHSSTHFWPSQLRVQIGQCCQPGPVSRSLLAFGGKGWYAERAQCHPGWVCLSLRGGSSVDAGDTGTEKRTMQQEASKHLLNAGVGAALSVNSSVRIGGSECFSTENLGRFAPATLPHVSGALALCRCC